MSVTTRNYELKGAKHFINLLEYYRSNFFILKMRWLIKFWFHNWLEIVHIAVIVERRFHSLPRACLLQISLFQ